MKFSAATLFVYLVQSVYGEPHFSPVSVYGEPYFSPHFSPVQSPSVDGGECPSTSVKTIKTTTTVTCTPTTTPTIQSPYHEGASPEVQSPADYGEVVYSPYHKGDEPSPYHEGDVPFHSAKVEHSGKGGSKETSPPNAYVMTDSTIVTAVNEWTNPATRQLAEDTYGDISTWDTSEVTDMSNLFREKSLFNDDIALWDTSSVTRMTSMFFRASAFDMDISRWDTSSVTYMSNMFYEATAFNKNLSAWDVSSVSYMSRMFKDASAFRQTLCWDVVASSSARVDMFTGSSGSIGCN